MSGQQSVDGKVHYFVMDGRGITLGIGSIPSTSLPLPADAVAVRLVATVDCFVAIIPAGGTDVVQSDGTNLFLPANTPEYFNLPIVGVPNTLPLGTPTGALEIGPTISVIWDDAQGLSGELRLIPCQ